MDFSGRAERGQINYKWLYKTFSGTDEYVKETKQSNVLGSNWRREHFDFLLRSWEVSQNVDAFPAMQRSWKTAFQAQGTNKCKGPQATGLGASGEQKEGHLWLEHSLPGDEGHELKEGL